MTRNRTTAVVLSGMAALMATMLLPGEARADHRRGGCQSYSYSYSYSYCPPPRTVYYERYVDCGPPPGYYSRHSYYYRSPPYHRHSGFSTGFSYDRGWHDSHHRHRRHGHRW